MLLKLRKTSFISTSSFNARVGFTGPETTDVLHFSARVLWGQFFCRLLVRRWCWARSPLPVVPLLSARQTCKKQPVWRTQAWALNADHLVRSRVTSQPHFITPSVYQLFRSATHFSKINYSQKWLKTSIERSYKCNNLAWYRPLLCEFKEYSPKHRGLLFISRFWNKDFVSSTSFTCLVYPSLVGDALYFYSGHSGWADAGLLVI